jgi:predicted neuraminidase
MTRGFSQLVFACVSGFATTAVAAEPGFVSAEFVFESAPFASCHASTIVETMNETLVTAFFAGPREGNPDVGIWVCRQVDGKWTAPVEAANGVQPDGKRQPCWNPVLFQAKNGPLLLFYKVGPSPDAWWGMLKTSDDDGKTWSAGRRLPDGILGPIKNKPVQLASGELLCPSSTEHDGWRVHFERTADLGRTWSRTGPLNDGRQIGAIQPSMLFRGGDRTGDKLLAVGRTRQKRLFQITSDDGGKTWSPMTLTSLPNPNSGIDAVTLSDGRQLLVYNHTERGRSPLNVAVSKDGSAWKAALVLDDEPQAEFSYPAVIQTHDGLVHCTYTWKRKKMRDVVLDPSRLVERDMVDGAWPK